MPQSEVRERPRDVALVSPAAGDGMCNVSVWNEVGAMVLECRLPTDWCTEEFITDLEAHARLMRRRPPLLHLHHHAS